MYDRNRLERWLRERRSGHTLPQPLYLEPDAFEFDLQAIFSRGWHMAGFECELPEPGSHLAFDVGRSPLVLVRQRDGSVAAFHNSCRHRGVQILRTGTGKAPRLTCPYHQWTYDLDGRLLSARGMDASFDAGAHGLARLRCEAVAGCLYVALSDEAPDFAPFRRVLEPALDPYGLRHAKVVARAELIESANWKLVMENGRECHHCAACHPALGKVLPVNMGETAFLTAESGSDFMRSMEGLGLVTGEHLGDWWQVGRYPFKPGAISYSSDGAGLVRQRLLDANEGNLGTLRWAIEPNNFCHVTSDMAFTFTANPIAPSTTVVTSKWLVHRDAAEGIDFQLDRLTEVWTRTNLEDRDLAENNHRGVAGSGYRPGPYSRSSESYVLRFVDWYCAEAERFLEGGGALRGGRDARVA